MLLPRTIVVAIAVTLPGWSPARAQDPLVATTEAALTAEDGSFSEDFGAAVAVSLDTLIVGCPGDSVHDVSETGSAYVFVRDGSSWTQQAKLAADDAAAEDRLGHAVAISGDTAVVTAIGDDGIFGGDFGSVYVFVRNGTSWSQQAKFTGGGSGDFGCSVAITGDTLIIGERGSGDDKGRAFIYARSGSTWSQQANLQPPGLGSVASFGTSVAIQGDTAIVGALKDTATVGGNPTGTAYVFTRSGGTWTQQAKLSASDASNVDLFGSAVALSGSTALIGAPGQDAPGAGSAGAAYCFVRNGTTWTEQAQLIAAGGESEDFAGRAVALRGGAAVVGAEAADPPAGVSSGETYVYVRSGTSWNQRLELKLDDPAPGAQFGVNIAMVGNTLFVAAPHYDPVDPGSREPSGAVLVLRLQSDWTDEGSGLAGVDGVPVLSGSGALVEGLPAKLSLADGRPSAASMLAVSVGSSPAPFKGGTLVAFPPLATVMLATLADGSLALPFTWPAGVPAGLPFYFQFAIADPAAVQGVSLSNALLSTTP